QLFKRAIEIDPKFATAYAQLGLVYELMGQPTRAAEYTTTAYQQRDRASDRERFLITTSYFLQVQGDLDQARQTAELWVRTYPRDVDPLGLLAGFIYPTVGAYDRGVEMAARAIEIDPDFVPAYLQLSFHNQFLGRLPKARAALERAAARHLEMPEYEQQRYDLAFLADDQPAMDAIETRARGKADIEDLIV